MRVVNSFRYKPDKAAFRKESSNRGGAKTGHCPHRTPWHRIPNYDVHLRLVSTAILGATRSTKTYQNVIKKRPAYSNSIGFQIIQQ